MIKLDYSRISYASFEYFELGGETWKLTDDAVNKGTSSRGLWNWMTNGRETVKVYKADVNAVNPRAAVAIFNGGVEYDPAEKVEYYAAAVALMDDELREELHAELSPCTEAEFLEAYKAAHLKKYGEEFQF